MRVLLVVIWAPSLPLFGNLDTWQLVINTITTIVTFLLVALLQNAQARFEKATNEKLNTIAKALALQLDSSPRRTNVPAQMRDAADELRRVAGLEDEVSA